MCTFTQIGLPPLAAGAALAGPVLGALLLLRLAGMRRMVEGDLPAGRRGLMQADTMHAGYKLMDSNTPGVAAAVSEDIRLGNAYAGELHKSEAVAQTGKEHRCALIVQPPPLRVNRQPVGR